MERFNDTNERKVLEREGRFHREKPAINPELLAKIKDAKLPTTQEEWDELDAPLFTRKSK